MMLETNADKMRRSPFISKELWQKCKGMAMLQNKTIGQWIAEAMREKYGKEVQNIKADENGKPTV